MVVCSILAMSHSATFLTEVELPALPTQYEEESQTQKKKQQTRQLLKCLPVAAGVSSGKLKGEMHTNIS